MGLRWPIPSTDASSRPAAIRQISSALGAVDAEMRDLRSARWIVGGPFVRLERARTQAEAVSAALTPDERGEFASVMDRYQALFDAIASAQTGISVGSCRIAAFERKAKEAADQKAAETLEAMKTRHLSVYQALQRKALEALKMKSLDTALST